MEKLINSIPKEVNAKVDPTTGQLNGNGFSLRWSVNRQKWLCGYSINFKDAKDSKYQPWEEANDPVEAVAIFVEKFSKHKR